MPRIETFFFIWTILAVVFSLFILLMPKRLSQFIPGRRRSRREQAADDRRLRAFYERESTELWDRSKLSPYEILGISREAGRREIEAAFKRRIKQYHPDKVAHLGEEYITVAKERSIRITNAREELLKKLDNK